MCVKTWHYLLTKFKCRPRGFTLLEMIVAIGIFALIIGSASWIIMHGFRYNRVIWEQLTTQNEGRRVLQQIVNQVRRAEQSSTGAYAVESAGNYEFIFFANVDGDSYRERVRFWLDNKTLKKGVIKPSGTPLQYLPGNETTAELAHNVVNISQSQPLFTYFDENYTGSESPLSSPVDITKVRIVKVKLGLEKDPSETPAPLWMESMAQVRNLKQN